MDDQADSNRPVKSPVLGGIGAYRIGQAAVAFGLKFNVIEMRGTQSRDRLSGIFMMNVPTWKNQYGRVALEGNSELFSALYTEVNSIILNGRDS
jgi:hypothetical protein